MATSSPRSAEDALRTAASAGLHLLPIPTPFAVGRVNCWLVDDDPLTLVDTGPNSATSLTQLEAALSDHGRKVEDLERIVVSHQHIDHLGLVSILAERSGAEVCALDRLAPWMATYSTRMEDDDSYAETIMRRNGIPEDVMYALRAVSASFRAWGGRATATRTMSDGSVLDFANRNWRVWHRPGHSPSDTIFHDEERRLLIGADHLLQNVSSNPLISRPLEGGDPLDRPQALVIYLASMQMTRAMDLDIVLSGHGPPITDHRALIDDRVRMHNRRADKIASIITSEPSTAYEIAQKMWGNVAVTQAYLTLSEVLGHVDLLLNDGRVHEVVDSDVVRLYAT